MSGPVVLRTLTRTDLAKVGLWFTDPDTQRFLGGPDWPGLMLEVSDRTVGQEFRGAVQTAAVRYLARRADCAVGYIDCGVFDRWAVYDGSDPDAPVISEIREVTTGYLALCVDPAVRGMGVGRAMVEALMRCSELGEVRRFAAGVDPANHDCQRCLRAAGFRLHTPRPDFEDMLYYLLDR